MNITLDITKRFNSIINTDCFFDNYEMRPFIYYNIKDEWPKTLEFELLNFGLNVSSEMDDVFNLHLPVFADIVQCDYRYRRLFIYGKAKLIIENVKGTDLKFADVNDILNGDKFYYSWPYKIERGDFYIAVGDSHITHHIMLLLI